ncbi:h domain protein [Skermania sp. ID1734]|uniref:h domain protein n=1 Tax=Skermania sp. ID1734 TaxID=2597516 RepID=UPI002103572F|nr:h domain protein [Skermania sp. ID1734]
MKIAVKKGNLTRQLAVGLGGIVVVALIVANVLLGLAYMHDRQSEQARTDAVAAASSEAEAMLGYDFNTVDKSLPKAADGLTGDFRGQYMNLVNGTIIPGAKEKQLTVKVSVQGAAVVDARPSDATVLLFLNQVTTSKDSPKAATTGSRVRVQMSKVDGRWLVSNLTPI